mmetsp:Transcript_106501/g.308183  ORF Transcript_106501/g.308183 Transcript_106501/m.308183 type:complete len:217 (+) Transcript_106501:1206-1856(+)
MCGAQPMIWPGLPSSAAFDCNTTLSHCSPHVLRKASAPLVVLLATGLALSASNRAIACFFFSSKPSKNLIRSSAADKRLGAEASSGASDKRRLWSWRFWMVLARIFAAWRSSSSISSRVAAPGSNSANFCSSSVGATSSNFRGDVAAAATFGIHFHNNDRQNDFWSMHFRQLMHQEVAASQQCCLWQHLCFALLGLTKAYSRPLFGHKFSPCFVQS